MSLDLDKLVSGQRTYQLNIRDALDTIKSSNDINDMLKKIVLFCKHAFSVNGNQRKKYLCCFLLRDISENIQSEGFEKLLESNIAQKLLKAIVTQTTGTLKQSRSRDEDNQQYSEKFTLFAIQTIVFWSKKNVTGKSAFRQVYQQLKKMKVQMPKNFKYYNPQLLLQLWNNETNTQTLNKKLVLSVLLVQLTDKFNSAKSIIENKISETLVHEQELNLQQIQKAVKQFLLMFFSRLKQIQDDTSPDKSSVVIYYHIMNAFYKKISNKQYIPISEMILLTRQAFQGNYDNQLSTVNKMDIINLAGTQKYNTLTIFQRIHKRIQQQEKLLPPCQISLEMDDMEKKKPQKSRILN